MGNWLPYNRDLVALYGADVAIFFSELCSLSEQYKAAEHDNWFYASAEKLIEKTGLSERKVEGAISTLCRADLIMIDKRPPFNRRHFRIVQNAADFKAAISIDAQTPTSPKKTAPQAKQEPNTAKEQSFGKPELVQEAENHTEQPLELAQPVGKSEQLPAEKPKKPKANIAEIEAAAVRLIEHFNAVAGTAFRTTGKANIECFGRVLKAKEGTEEEIRMVIELKTMQWAKKPEMREYLKPETLCRPSHFSKYLEEAYAVKNQQASGQRAPSYFAAQDNNLTIELPNGQRFGDYFDRKDQRKVDMIRATLTAHPGIHVHLNPQLADMAYLSSLNETELQAMLKRARLKWYPPNTFTDSKELPF
jgi:uncharacterized phage protein (TIGR02220 family)